MFSWYAVSAGCLLTHSERKTRQTNQNKRQQFFAVKLMGVTIRYSVFLKATQCLLLTRISSSAARQTATTRRTSMAVAATSASGGTSPSSARSTSRLAASSAKRSLTASTLISCHPRAGASVASGARLDTFCHTTVMATGMLISTALFAPIVSTSTRTRVAARSTMSMVTRSVTTKMTRDAHSTSSRTDVVIAVL